MLINYQSTYGYVEGLETRGINVEHKKPPRNPTS